VVVDHDPTTGTSSLRTSEGPVPLKESTAAMITCDAQVVLANGQRMTGAGAVPLPGGLDKPTPPGLRRQIKARDAGRCKICGSRLGLMAHHIIFRSQGGDTAAQNLVLLCFRCHSMVHEGLLRVEGQAPHALRFLDEQGRDLRKPQPGLAAGGLVIEREEVACQGAAGGARAPRAASPAATVTMGSMPDLVDARWWRGHRHLFSWSGRGRGLEFAPGVGREVELPVSEGPAVGLSAGDRPAGLADVIGQEKVVAGLKLAVQAARKEGRPLGHVLFEGPPGLGKTSLAAALAREMGARLHLGCGATLEDSGQLVNLLCGLSAGDVVFVDEIHALPRKLCELLYQAMEDGSLSLPVNSGMEARQLTIALQPFTLVGATTDPDRMPGPLRERFCLQKVLEFYELPELVQIVNRAAERRKLDLKPDAAESVAQAARGTPRVALRLVAQLADLAVARARHVMELPDVQKVLELEGLNAQGLGPRQRAVLDHLRKMGHPVGTRRLAAVLGVALRTFKLVVEPDLVRLGLVSATPRGLVATT